MANLSSYLPGGIDPAAVTITGGTINGTTIGASTPSTGAFTSLTATSASTITTADNNPQLTLISTDADASEGPVLKLYRNSGSPADNDILGRIQFSGEDDAGNDSTFGRIDVVATDVSNNSEDARMEFSPAVGDAFTPTMSLVGGTVGIGTTTPAEDLNIVGASGTAKIRFDGDSSNLQNNFIGITGYDDLIIASDEANSGTASTIQFRIDAAERMRIDSSGSVLVGKTSLNYTSEGIAIEPDRISGVRNGTIAIWVRNTTDGEIFQFKKDTTTVGAINTRANQLAIGCTGTGIEFNDANDAVIPFSPDANNTRDNALDLGSSGVRWDDIYATNDVINTSDAREKQDIEELTEAEARVAVAAKALLRKYRWKSAVRTKSHDARIHFGIIAQDLQAAFEAEGLDAGEYGMFICSEWWETYTDVPAVEAVEAQDAVYDEEGNLLSEAVEAVKAVETHTRTDTYNTEAEAPEDAVRKDRMGVRYSELLAFIIAAI